MVPQYNSLVHWKTDDGLPLWQLCRRGYRLRVNITSMFNSKFLITAIRGLSDEEAIYLKGRMEAGDIPCEPCGAAGFMGFDATIFDHTNMVGVGWGWHVTNNAMEAPAFIQYMKDGKIGNIRLGEDLRERGLGEDVRDHVAKHPDDGYTVQFENVPWGVFKRYWRKPINLDRRFHRGKTEPAWRRRYGHESGHPAIELLHFDMRMLREYKCMFIDFHRADLEDTQPKMSEWMIQHAKKFRPLSDDDSPFVKGVSEFLFTTDWMCRLP